MKKERALVLNEHFAFSKISAVRGIKDELI
jgi:hypothetical protein